MDEPSPVIEEAAPVVEKAAKSRAGFFLKRAVPVAVSAGILYYYFHGQDWRRLWELASECTLWLALAGIVIPQLYFWVCETAVAERHFTWFHGPFPFWTFFWVRGSIYILMFINVALGSGGLLFYMQKKAEISWRKLLGIVLFRLGLTLFGIAVIMIPATFAMHHYGLMEKAHINPYLWWGFLAFGVVYLINSWMTWHHGARFGISRLVVRDRESEFWTAFRTASKRQWFITWALAIPPLFLTVLGFYLVALAFSVKIPLLEFMVAGPLMLIVMDLPIAFAGFGTATLGWVVFFGDYGTAEQIGAITLFLPAVRSLTRAAIGVVSLRPALKDIQNLFGDK